MIITHGNYKDLEYEIIQDKNSTSYSIFDFGKITGERINIQSGTTNDDKYTEEYVKSEIDKIISEIINKTEIY